jgi:hypothetical protein
MTTSSEVSKNLIRAGKDLPSSPPSQLPEILRRAGGSAVFAAEEFFYGRIRNVHTRPRTYMP